MPNNVRDQGDGSDSGSDNEELNDITPEQLAPIEVPPNEHKLQYNYWLWFMKRPPRNNSSQGYGKALRLVGRCGSVEQWWGLYSHLKRPSDLPPHTDLHLFKLGIKPMWEDAANINGGKWMVRLRKGLAGRAWEDLCMAMLGEQFMVGDELCGAVISIRFQEDLIAVWHRTAADTAAASRVRDTLRRVLHLPATVHLEYKVHGESHAASNGAPPYRCPPPSDSKGDSQNDDKSEKASESSAGSDTDEPPKLGTVQA